MYIIIYNNYAVLCDLLKENNPTAEIVLMTPTYNDQGIDTRCCLDAYSNMVIQLANDKGFKYIDLHKLWMEHLIVGSDNCGQRDRLSSCTGDACLFSKKGAEATAHFFQKSINQPILVGKQSGSRACPLWHLLSLHTRSRMRFGNKSAARAASCKYFLCQSSSFFLRSRRIFVILLLLWRREYIFMSAVKTR